LLEGVVAVLLVDCPWFDCACELVSPVFGVDWLLAVEDLSEEVDEGAGDVGRILIGLALRRGGRLGL
jgi:hypothetical protein